MRVPAPAPGFYYDIPFEVYRSWNAVNSHALNGFSRTPAHVKWELLHGDDEGTRATELGGLVHMAVLEPERFERDVVIPPTVRKQGKANLEIWRQFHAANEGKTYAKQADIDAARFMRDSLMNHPTAGELLRNLVAREVCVVWVDAETGVLCKARFDGVGPVGAVGVVADLKTGESMGRTAFERAVVAYGYHVQGAHYLDGAESVAPSRSGPRRYVIPFVETKPPYCAGCYELDEEALAIGAGMRNAWLRRWRECVEAGMWAGYPDGLETVSVPAWERKRWNTEEA